MGAEIQWLIGSLMAAIGVVGGIIMRDRHLIKSITDGDEKLHQRVNRIQTEYVRREELNQLLNGLEKSVAAIQSEQRETNRRIDRLLDVIAKQKGGE